MQQPACRVLACRKRALLFRVSAGPSQSVAACVSLKTRVTGYPSDAPHASVRGLAHCSQNFTLDSVTLALQRRQRARQGEWHIFSLPALSAGWA